MISRTRERWSPALLVFGCLWLAAITPGVVATRDLRWPYDHDGFRDVALAQKAADGHWLADPYYRGESLWYSPLTAWLVAGTSGLTGLPAPRAFIIVGHALHVLIPLAFFVCARGLIGQWPAVVATSLFLFLPARAPAWAAATYSPWLFPAVTAQLFFYGGLAVWLRFLGRPSLWLAASAGLLLGLTVLTHLSAGALLAAIVVVTASIGSAGTPAPPLLRRLSSLALTAGIALVVALPLVVALAMRPGTSTVNRAPATWVYELAEPESLARSLLKPASWALLLACGWGGRLMWASSARARIVFAAWGGTALAGFVYCLAAERVERLPAILPAYHFLFQLRAWQWIVAGLGITAAAQAAAGRLTRSGPRWFLSERAACGLMLVAAAAALPRYVRREAFVEAPRVSRQLAERGDLSAAYTWIRQSTPRDAVVLASDIDSMLIVGPTGRYAVCVGAPFSNPTVDVATRCAARDELMGALRSGRAPEVRRLTADLGVTHVLARGDAAAEIAQHASVARPVFTAPSSRPGTGPGVDTRDQTRPQAASPVGLSDERLTIFEIGRP